MSFARFLCRVVRDLSAASSLSVSSSVLILGPKTLLNLIPSKGQKNGGAHTLRRHYMIFKAFLQLWTELRNTQKGCFLATQW